VIPEQRLDENAPINFAISYCEKSPDAKMSNIKEGGIVGSIIKSYDSERLDNPLTTRINSITIEKYGKFCFIVYDIEDFYGKNPEEKDFIKKSCFLINLEDNNRVVEKFSYIVRQVSRFKIEAKFLNKSAQEIFLVLKIVSCINDIDPFNAKELDWVDFETSIKVFGPFNIKSLNLKLYDEFKMCGEALNESICLTGDYYFGSIMQECNKLFDKHELSLVKAKRFDINFNLCDLFDKNKDSSKVQLFSLNEFLAYEETLSGKYTYIDLRAIQNNNFLLIYSKQGFVSEENTSKLRHYEYDYSRYKFKRDIKTSKGALVYDPRTNKVVKQFKDIFDKETNVETLLFCNQGYILDDLWNLFSINTGQLVHKIRTSPSVSLNFAFTQFILSGRYILTANLDGNMIYVIRCYDSFIVASLRIDNCINCLKTGDSDRIILAGTKTGQMIGSLFLIDMEFEDAIKNHVGFCRTERKKQLKSLEKLPVAVTAKQFEVEEVSKVNLNHDLKRVIHSAHAHRQLRSKESLLSASSFLSQNSSVNAFNNAASDFHIGIAKTNLTRITSGIKNSPITTRACQIQ